MHTTNRYGKVAAYGQSKLANVLHANELARRLKEEGVNITANSLHPGAIATNLYRHNAFAKCSRPFLYQNIQEKKKKNASQVQKHCIKVLKLSAHIAVSFSFHAGVVNTLGRFVLKNIQQGAATTCYVALHPQVKGVSGEYFVASTLSKASSQGRDMDLAKKLWDFSLNLTR